MIATIGVAILLTNLMQGRVGAEVRRFPQETLPESSFVIGNIHANYLQLSIIFIAFVLMLGLWFLMRKTQLGWALRAIAESPRAAA
jgi:branched-chain amino acid transport system permease protein